MKAATAAAIAGAAAALLCGTVASFSPPAPPRAKTLLAPRNMFFADSAPVEAESKDAAAVEAAPVEAAPPVDAPKVNINILDGSEASIAKAAEFLVDAFWLRSPQQLIQGGTDPSEVSESARASLVKLQADDLMNKYGELMGSRKLDALILAATDEEEDAAGDLLGMVTVEVRLLDKRSDVLSGDASEFKMTQAVASLGPKQRREYKNASPVDVANQLLPPDVSAVAVLANLCVSPAARRRGVAAALCEEVGRVAKDELGFEELHLRVEEGNAAARGLYEGKLGYERVLEVGGATALRVDGDAGTFEEVVSDMVVLKKKIS